MAKSLLHRMFGLGKVPKAHRSMFEQEGIVVLDEGLSGSVTLRNFRSPNRRSGYRKSMIVGSIVITKLRIAAFGTFNPVINLGLDHPALARLKVSVPHSGRVQFDFDAADFHEGWSGQVSVCFNTQHAREIERILSLAGTQ